MNLLKYLNKEVVIITHNGLEIKGKAVDYIPPQDNIPEIASISVGNYEIYEDEIKDIKILNN